MIEEKSLCAAMRSAWKNGGYEVFARGDSLVITTSAMGVEMSRRNASRQVLALLVMHLGEIPEDAAYSVRNRVDGAERRILRRTPMDWKNSGVWQADDTGIVYAFDKALTDIICAEPEGIEVADGLMVCDDGGGLAVIYPEEGKMTEAVRNLLEQVSLT